MTAVAHDNQPGRASVQTADGTHPVLTNGRRAPKYFTIPNMISIARLIGAFVLIFVAQAGYPRAFLISFFVLHLSDWIDGRLARWLNQHSAFGARLDSVSDAVLYACLLAGCLILNSEMMYAEAPWLFVAMGSYALTTLFGLWKYGQAPSYHTLAAKKSQWLVLAAGASVILNWSPIPLRIATVAVTLTNLEATAMTGLLKNWHPDILSIIDLLPTRRRAARRRMKSRKNPDPTHMQAG